MLLRRAAAVAGASASSAVARRRLSSGAPRLFCPVSHTWIDVLTSSSLRIGLTPRGCEDIGDLTAFTPLVAPGECVRKAEQPLARLEWESFHITDGDELYHTRWDNVAGETCLFSPINAAATAFHVPPQACARSSSMVISSLRVDEEDWLVELEVADASASPSELASRLRDASPHLVASEDEYERLVEESGAAVGTFGDRSDQRLDYTSYG